MPNRPFLPDFVLTVCGDAWRLGRSSVVKLLAGGDLEQGDGQLQKKPRCCAPCQRTSCQGSLWSTSESWTIRRFDWRQVQWKSQAWLVGWNGHRWNMVQLGWLKWQRHKDKVLRTQNNNYINCLLVEIWIWNAWAFLGLTSENNLWRREETKMAERNKETMALSMRMVEVQGYFGKGLCFVWHSHQEKWQSNWHFFPNDRSKALMTKKWLR